MKFSKHKGLAGIAAFAGLAISPLCNAGNTLHYTPFNDDGRGNLVFLDRHYVDCSTRNAGISSLKLQRNSTGNNIRYRYNCKTFSSASQFTNQSTPFNNDGRGNAIYLDRHSVDCNNRPISQFVFRRNSAGNLFHYEYKCSDKQFTSLTKKLDTGFNDDGGGNSVFLDRHHLQCDSGEMLGSFRLVRNSSGNQYRYEYTCGSVGVFNQKCDH